jgi:Conserved secreted protein
LSCVSLSGCAIKFGKPEIQNISHEWGAVTNSTTEVITNITVYNPNPISLPLKDVRTKVYMGNTEMGEGSALQSDIKANSESTIVISTKIENDKIPQWWVEYISNNKTSLLKINGTLVFDLKVTDFEYPFGFSSPIGTNILASLSSEEPQNINAGPVTLKLESIESRWGSVTDNNTEIITNATIYNDNLYPIPITGFSYSIELNGITMAQGSSSESTTLTPKSETVVPLSTNLNNDMLDDWWVSHIKNREVTEGKVIIQPTISYLGNEFQCPPIEQEFKFNTTLLQGF